MNGPILKAENHENRLDPRSANVEAAKLFREVFTNVALQERALFLDKKVKQVKLEERAKYVNKLFQRFTTTVYSIPKEYFDDAVTTPFTTRLFELSQIARLNYAISHLIEGDKENLKRSYTAIQRLKLDLQKAKHQHYFQLSELRINALEDLLAAFGFFDETVNNLSVSTQSLLSIETTTSIELIDRIATGVNTFSPCARVLLVENPSQGMTILEQLLTTTEKLAQQRKVSDKPSDMLLSLDNLLKIANYYHINFQLCRIESHSKYSHIFAPKGEMITCRSTPNTTCVYLIIDDRQQMIIGMFVKAEPKINDLLQQLDTAKSNTDRIDLNLRIAQIYRERAEDAEIRHHLLALPIWYDALKHYEAACNLSDNTNAALGLLRCMIMLGRYARADNTLRTRLSSTMMTCGEAWYLRAIACRKQQQFDDAYFCAREAVRLNYSDAEKELNLCEKLKADSIENRIMVYKRMTTRYTNNNQLQPDYNILSIDGGGCRGIIPAFWLTELERHTKKSCASLFHMMAGTSTGAIISAGLAMPAIDGSDGPQYKAFDILELYRNQTVNVFSLSSGMMNWLGSSLGKSARYCDTGRSNVFQQYFGDIHQSNLLVDTVIPAVTSTNNATHLFTYHHRKARQHYDDYKIKDILMCTTAAPTYFDPYKLATTLYVDGGVQANNPTMEAFGQAVANGIRQENIFVLSLGTGDYVPDPLHLNANRNLLFWATNSETIAKVIFDGPQSNIDLNMSRILPDDRYHRWQVWLEKPVTLDDTSTTNLNMLFEMAREHFEAMDALDSRKRLGLLIDHLKGDNYNE